MFKRKLTGRVLTWGVALFSLFVVLESSIRANGIYGDGTGARSMSMGGADVAWAQSPLEAMGDNPAGLGFLTEREFDLGGVGAITEGHFNKPSASSSGDLNDTPGGLPEAALGLPLGNGPLSIGISVIPDSMLLADWKYLDPPGGLGGVSYGVQTDKSEIIVLRSAIGMGLTLTPKLSLGASIGIIYNKNQLQTSYVFQNLQPSADAPYDGAKTLLNLHTSGFGWNAQAGLLYRPLTNLQFGISYKSQYTVDSTGGASGDPYAQFGGVHYPFHYDAEVDNTFPQQVSMGVSWKFHPQWRAAAQVDWIDWSGAFHTLPVILKNGNNPTVNSVLGSSFQDNIPLNWKDEFVYRAGLEYAVTENLSLRAGYSYGKSPVPDSTLTPMTAAIMEHTVTAGVGYRWRQFQFDLAYQYDLPVTRNVGTNGLLSGEYSNSSTEVGVHWLALTTSVRF
jgi:long-chain fatty acid transport protein